MVAINVMRRQRKVNFYWECNDSIDFLDIAKVARREQLSRHILAWIRIL